MVEPQFHHVAAGAVPQSAKLTRRAGDHGLDHERTGGHFTPSDTKKAPSAVAEEAHNLRAERRISRCGPLQTCERTTTATTSRPSGESEGKRVPSTRRTSVTNTRPQVKPQSGRVL